MPFQPVFYVSFSAVLSPVLILLYAVFYKNYACQFNYRILGHYKFNFTFKVFEIDKALVSSLKLLISLFIAYISLEIGSYSSAVSNREGRVIDTAGFEVL
mmetsp:Transcript_8785/g.13558  ORF Transcript_8785/g.13558 Transcript_8785/m.13558 type:complete len:100 (+) Transcript_8785:851-1150(+)